MGSLYTGTHVHSHTPRIGSLQSDVQSAIRPGKTELLIQIEREKSHF